jgi:hypothetical protein
MYFLCIFISSIKPIFYQNVFVALQNSASAAGTFTAGRALRNSTSGGGEFCAARA